MTRLSEPPLVEYKGINGTLSIRRPALAVVLVTFVGHDAGDFGPAPFWEIDKDIAAYGAVELFIDAREGKGASIDVSGEWALWLKSRSTALRGIHMLTGSRFVQLSADFVRRFAQLGEGMRLYTDATAFDDALAVALAEKR
jgi:hypothetical protein